MADLLWLEANASLSSGDLATAEALLGAVTAMDPRPVYFWVNAARITACDIAAGRVAAFGGASRLPAGVWRRMGLEQARRALRVLDAALQHHPESPALWIERENLQLGRLGDMDGAATSYRRAAARPGAPYFAARLHAELLRRLGRKEEALAWLIRLHPRLPAGEPAAAADLVLARIHGLEQELGVPEGRRYRRL